jgi:uncharacterized membrane protein AbrB (regulator of aidB expression)
VGKSAIGSLTVVSALVVLGAQIAQMVGYTITEGDQQAIVNLINSGLIVVTTVISMIAALGAIWGRMRATQQITGVVTASPAPPLQASPPGTTAADLNNAELERIRQGGRE